MTVSLCLLLAPNRVLVLVSLVLHRVDSLTADVTAWVVCLDTAWVSDYGRHGCLVKELVK